jgi:hypothetical protein
MKLELLQQIFEKKNSNKKFRKNPSSGSLVVPCGRTDGQTRQLADMTKLIVDLLNFANASKNENADLRSMHFGYTYIKSVKPPPAFGTQMDGGRYSGKANLKQCLHSSITDQNFYLNTQI